MFRKLLLITAAALAMAAPGASHAATRYLVAHGTFTSGTDTSGIFFGAGADLTGQAVDLTLFYDTETTITPVGGVFQSTSPGWLSMQLTFIFPGGFGGLPLLTEGASYFGELGLTNSATVDTLSAQIDSTGRRPGSEFDVDEHVTLDLAFGDLFTTVGRLPRISGDHAATGGASVSFMTDNCGFGQSCLPVRYLAGEIAFTSVSGSVLGTGVPEPATWALMIAGFGGAGAMLRRRRAGLATA